MDIKISVRNLVEFIFRSGDISDSSNGTLSKEAMNAGSRIHRKLQKKAGSYYNAEVPLKLTIERNSYNVTVEGRADGIIEKNTNVTIDEIKGIYKKLSDIEEPVKVHKAQAMCYAYIYAKYNSLEKICVQMTYVNLDTEEIKRFNEEFTFEYLEGWYQNLIDELLKWVDYAAEHIEKRDMSIAKLEFPFEYRKGQKKMAACVYKAIADKKNMFVQAPTGIGKTMAAVFPAIKAFSTGLTTKLFYLTAKTIAHTVAASAIEMLRKQELVFQTVTITAKEKICLLPEMECNPEKCAYANGHFDRINEALYDLITHEEFIDRNVVTAYAGKHMVCPFELSLDATLFADGIICDYNYVFDPRVNLKRFFASDGREDGKYTFLVDEAHNLVDRASAMYSAALIKEDFLDIKKIVKKYSEKTAKSIDKCNKEFLALKKELGGDRYNVLDGIGEIYFKLLNLHSYLESFLEDYKHIPERKDVLEFYFKLTSFLNISELVDDSYVIYDELLDDGTFMLREYCVHPANNLKLCLDKGISTIFFSATILPVRYYMEMLSDQPEDYAIYISSPFEQANRRIMLGLDVTTRYTRRTEQEYANIYEYIRSMVNGKRGNYMVFFPSYQMMNKVYDIAKADEANNDIHIIMQNQHMNEEEREAFLKEFSDNDNILSFCIMGGIFSEGIDLDGEKLIGAIVVGPGIPQVCTERRIMMDYFNNRKRDPDDRGGTQDGFKYAYLYPGINKVFQAAGRVIRTENDKGIILLLDERFASNEYFRLFPVEWNDYMCVNRKNIAQYIDDFWAKFDK
ncbi:MAG: ATP-dependent DNA helicase [Coprococcus sp.]